MHPTDRQPPPPAGAAGALGAAAAWRGPGSRAAAPAARQAPARHPARAGGMPRERYLQYVDWFNDNDPRFLEFYHPDVVLELGNATTGGANAHPRFLRRSKGAHPREGGSDALRRRRHRHRRRAAHRSSRSTRTGRSRTTSGAPLKAGEVFRVISLGHVLGGQRPVPPHQGGALQARQRLEDGRLTPQADAPQAPGGSGEFGYQKLRWQASQTSSSAPPAPAGFDVPLLDGGQASARPRLRSPSANATNAGAVLARSRPVTARV